MLSDEDIQRIVMRTIEYEGTEYEDVPGDSGGGTKFGVGRHGKRNCPPVRNPLIFPAGLGRIVKRK